MSDIDEKTLDRMDAHDRDKYGAMDYSVAMLRVNGMATHSEAAKIRKRLVKWAKEKAS